MKYSAMQEKYFPLPSQKDPWFVIPVDDPGPFRYFILHVLSSRYQSRRFIIRLLRLFVILGGHFLWPVFAQVALRYMSYRNRV